jgi:hypothetical protein
MSIHQRKALKCSTSSGEKDKSRYLKTVRKALGNLELSKTQKVEDTKHQLYLQYLQLRAKNKLKNRVQTGESRLELSSLISRQTI